MRPELINPLALAYLGDGVFEVYVREYLIVDQEITKPDLLLHEWVDEDEIRIYKRGRNAKNTRVMKNTSVITHNQSSGFEALIGHLYLLKKEKRIQEIFELYKEFVMRNL